MILRLFPVFFLFILIACNSGQNTAAVQDSLATTGTTKKITKAISQNENTEQSKLANILGVWTDGSSENASFDIRKDSIYYVDPFSTYKYSLTDDSIKIFYPDWTFTGEIHLSKDTLIIASEDGTTKYWKFKN